MVKFLLISILFIGQAQANLFDFSSDKPRESKVPALLTALKGIELKVDPLFEDEFNKAVKNVEAGIEEEKLYCSGDSPDAEGNLLPKDQKQLCMRELKKHYLEASTTIFELKKKYLTLIHENQLEKLNEIQKKLKADIEKNF